MNPETDEVAHDLPPFFKVLRNGRVHRYKVRDLLPPSKDSKTGVESRDVVISPENNVSARIFLPEITGGSRKLPLIIYIHGGAFSLFSAFSSHFHHYVNALASASGSIVVSIEYRLAPEHPIPACYEDSYAAIKWVDSHRSGQGADPWINEYANFDRVYIAGDSAGANIAHNMVSRGGFGSKFSGLILIHPFFGTPDKLDELWEFICSEPTGPNDLRLYPMADLYLLSKLECDRVLVCVAEKDFLRDRGLNYHQALKNANWKGVLEFFETPDEVHAFHLHNMDCENATLLMKKVVSFINSE